MKKLLVALCVVLSNVVFSQPAINTAFTTTKVETSIMYWSTVQEKYIFVENEDLTDHEAYWEFDLEEGGQGGHFLSGDDILYSVYAWRVDVENRIVWVDFYSHKRKEDGQLAITTGEDGGNALIFFMPDSKISYVFY